MRKTPSDYLIPLILTVGTGFIGWMANSVNELAGTMKVLVFRVDTHEKRIQALEEVWDRD